MPVFLVPPFKSIKFRIKLTKRARASASVVWSHTLFFGGGNIIVHAPARGVVCSLHKKKKNFFFHFFFIY
jgi:hypothetical protein